MWYDTIMNKFIRLTNTDAKDILLNKDKIISIVDRGECRKITIRITNYNEAHYVLETIDEITYALQLPV